MTKLHPFSVTLLLATLAGSALGQVSSISAPTPNVVAKTGDITATSAFRVLNSDSTELLRVQSNRYVGIGESDPKVRLDLKGNSVDFGGQLRLQATDFDQITFYNSNNPALIEPNRLGFLYYDIANQIMRMDNQAGAKRMILNGSGGNVGVGTTTPEVLLDLKANNVPYGGQLRLQAPDYDQITFYNSNNPVLNQANRLGDIYYDIAGTKLHIDNWAGDNTIVLNGNGSGGGYIGIDASAPTAMLQIGPLSPAYFRDMSTVNATSGVLLEMTANSEIHIGGLRIGKAAMPVIETIGGTAGNNALLLNRFSDNDVVIGRDAYGLRGLKVESTGPSTFAGSVTVTGSITGGTINATFQDVAEWVPAAGSPPAGTVVVISDDTNNTVMASTRAYDTGVAGVVSPSPGLLLGVEGPSKAKIATTGRVKVRVDASKGPIRMGDLLVTSNRPGMAMKSEPLDLGGVKIHRTGTLIGKALEPMASGQGEILVLLSLQ